MSIGPLRGDDRLWGRITVYKYNDHSEWAVVILINAPLIFIFIRRLFRRSRTVLCAIGHYCLSRVRRCDATGLPATPTPTLHWALSTTMQSNSLTETNRMSTITITYAALTHKLYVVWCTEVQRPRGLSNNISHTPIVRTRSANIKVYLTCCQIFCMWRL